MLGFTALTSWLTEGFALKVPLSFFRNHVRLARLKHNFLATGLVNFLATGLVRKNKVGLPRSPLSLGSEGWFLSSRDLLHSIKEEGNKQT